MKLQSRIAVAFALTLSLGLGCGEYTEPTPPRDGFYFPVGLELHPNGRFLYIVNSNFDLRYREDQGGTVLVFDTESREILPNSSPLVPSFAGQIALNEDATRAYVTSRLNNEITLLKVGQNGGGLYCEVDGQRRADTRSCQVRRLPDVQGAPRVPSDPFGIAVGRATRTIGGEERDFDVVHLSHLRGEHVTAMSFPDGEISGGSMRSATLLPGGNQLVIRPGTQDVYVAGRNTGQIAAFRPYLNENGEVEAIVRRGNIEINRRQENADARGLAFDESGQWLYVATRRPSALHIIGMEAGPEKTPRVVNSIALEARPSEVVVHQGADGVKRIYVPSYTQGLIQVIDAEQEALVDLIEVGRSPYQMVVERQPVSCRAPGERCLGYVTLFDAGEDGGRCDDDDSRCGALAIIDLDPESETFHRVIETIR